MSKKYTINVTQAHIDEAIRRRNLGEKDLCGNCPIAIAAQEQIKPGLRVTLDYIYEPLQHTVYNLPEAGLRITSVANYSWHTLKPTSFEVKASELL